MEHRVPTVYTECVENSNLLLPEEEFHPVQIFPVRAAKKRGPFDSALLLGISTRGATAGCQNERGRQLRRPLRMRPVGLRGWSQLDWVNPL